MAKLTIDGVDYDTDAMTDAAKAQLTSVQFCENEIRRLQAEASLLQTARNAYLNALKAELTRKRSDPEVMTDKSDIAQSPNDAGEKTEKKGFLGGLFGKK